MTTAHKTISTANMPRSDWLVLRRRSIGGSDAAAVLGLTRYASPMTVWGEKRCPTPIGRYGSHHGRSGADLPGRQRTTYDMKKFIREHPEIDMKPYQKITEYRQFNVKE